MMSVEGICACFTNNLLLRLTSGGRWDSLSHGCREDRERESEREREQTMRISSHSGALSCLKNTLRLQRCSGGRWMGWREENHRRCSKAHKCKQVGTLNTAEHTQCCFFVLVCLFFICTRTCRKFYFPSQSRTTNPSSRMEAWKLCALGC